MAMIDALEAQGRIAPGQGRPGRADLGQHRHRARFRRGGARLQAHAGDARSRCRWSGARCSRCSGAELVLTPAALGMKGAIAKANEIVATTPGAIIPQQFENPANPRDPSPHHGRGDLERHGRRGRHRGRRRRHRRHDHRRRSGAEGAQAERADGRGRAGRLRPCCPAARPGRTRSRGSARASRPPILDQSVIDEIVAVGNQTAFDTARLTARIEGVPVGISSGAAIAAAIDVGRRPENAGKTIVVIIPSFAERYLSTALFEGL